jgi:hypothetical protein
MTISVADLINNIENGTLADAEQVFKDIMDVKAGNALNTYRQEIATNIFNGGEEDLGVEGSDEDFDDESLDDISGEDDAEI